MYLPPSPPPPPGNNKKTVYPSIGECIYCGALDQDLRDEHIIPLALNGNLILEKGSCMKCEKITSAFEGTVARSIFGDFRIKYNIKSRRRNKRPTSKTLKITGFRNSSLSIEVPRKDFPAPLFMYVASRAGILDLLPTNHDGLSKWTMVGYTNKLEMEKFQEKYGKNMAFDFRHVPNEFCRTLAKICYSYAVATLGKDKFKSLVTDIILGNTNNYSYLIGGEKELPQPIANAGHLLSCEVLVDSNRALVVVRLRFFASICLPEYHVVVGEITDQQSLMLIAKSALSMKAFNVSNP